MRNTFAKAERLSSKTLIDRLFAGGNPSMAFFPLRIVYMKVQRDGEPAAPVSILVSVPKKRFRHATDRNRMKRQVREAYRVGKHELVQAVSERDYNLAVAFVCITDNLTTHNIVKKSMSKALARIVESLADEA